MNCISAIQQVNQGNISLLKKRPDTNTVYHTVAQDLYVNDVFKNFSVKVLLRGEAIYKSGTSYTRLASPFDILIAPSHDDSSVELQSGNTTELICIDMQQDLIQQAISYARKDIFSEKQISNDELFAKFSGSYRLEELGCKSIIEQLHKGIIKDCDKVNVNQEWFLNLATALVSEKKSFSLDCIKKSTKDELMRRLMIAKDYIDESFLFNPPVRQVAKISMMSPYHFFRSFKKAFGVTPYQYMLDKRLQYSLLLMQNGEMPIEVIAYKCMFADLFTFSKAFKRNFGICPSIWRRQIKSQLVY
jgi:AraC family transcriptional regulator